MDEAALVRFARSRLVPVLGEEPAGSFFLAGGAFKSLLHGRPPRDLDVWPATPGDRELLAEQLVRRGAQPGRDNPPYQTSYTQAGQLVELAYDASAARLEDRLGRCDLALSAVDLMPALEQIASEQFNSLTEQVKVAIREYLERLDRLPKPGRAKPKS